MEVDIYKKYCLLNEYNVPRGTLKDFEKFILMIRKKNSEINIISKDSDKIELIRSRHIIDSAQAIDFVDLNKDTTCDIGSGGGMPGIVIAIMLKNLKNKMKIKLYEKSYHKSLFLKEVSRKLELDTEVIQEDIFLSKNLKSGTIMARAFKPLPVVLDLIHKNFINYKNLVLFMGKTGRDVLNETLKSWDFDYKEKKSITSKDSFLLNIKNIKKIF